MVIGSYLGPRWFPRSSGLSFIHLDILYSAESRGMPHDVRFEVLVARFGGSFRYVNNVMGSPLGVCGDQIEV